ncbi:MAG: SDR family NAD(P)-dependent oxidoreductase [Gammaproteobacteria bacterium]|nr:SDR family NAD(P)-dependent oxidoreductase [Gammaproteobacteria bacterium]
MQDFAGKVAVITGAASGIGLALTEKCLDEGMQVVMADIEEQVLDKAAEKLRERGHNSILAVPTDVAVLEQIEALCQKTIDQFGEVHLLFNNAGVGGGGNSWQATNKDWEWVMGVNLFSVIHGLRVFVPQMISQGNSCHIVNTASVAGLLDGVANASYAVTKHGVVALTEILFRDLGQENVPISCSVLCPGIINTNILTSHRNRPADLTNQQPDPSPSAEQENARSQFAALMQQGMPTSQVADIVFKGIREETLYIQTHDSFNQAILDRAQNITTATNPPLRNLTPDE